MGYSRYVIKAITKIKNNEMNLQFVQIGQLFSRTDTFITKLGFVVFTILEYVLHRPTNEIYVEILGRIIDMDVFRKIMMYINLVTQISHIIMYYVEHRRF